MSGINSQSFPEKPQENRRVIFFLAVALIFLIGSAIAGGLLFASSAGFGPAKVFQKLRSLTLAREKMLKGEEDNRVNLLLLGMGGVGHEGATLTDTIVFASVRPSDGKVALLSIPRDLQVWMPRYSEYRRINTANAYAERDDPGEGGAAASEIVSSILGQHIHYYLRVDFKAFEQIIDTIGGIEVGVEHAFYDPFYPDDNFGYAPVAFEAGVQTMNGERALKFVRSRHGTNGEGNDFARARRQQKVLFALKERLLSFDVLLRPNRMKTILESLQNNIRTNIEFWEGMRLANLIRNVAVGQIQSVVLDTAPDGVLRERYYNGAFMLEPKDATWGQVRAIAEGLLDEATGTLAAVSAPSPLPAQTVPPAPPLTPPSPPEGGEGVLKRSPLPVGEGQGDGTAQHAPSPLVEIQNGTLVNGLAARTAERLESLGFNPISLGNAPVRDVQTTIIYDLTGGMRPEEFTRLKTELGAIEGEGEPLEILRKGELDFLVILGSNAAK